MTYPTPEEEKQIAIECKLTIGMLGTHFMGTHEQLHAFALRMFELGRKMQREIDAGYLETICDTPYFAEAIRNNTGE